MITRSFIKQIQSSGVNSQPWPGGGVPPVHVHPLWALSGPQTPRPIILHPPFPIPGYGPETKSHVN